MKQKILLFLCLLLSTLTASAQTDLTGATVALTPTSFDYDGTAHEPKVSGIRKGTIRYNSLVEGVDYDLSYTDNVNAGEATATLTFKGNYTGVATKTFTISPKDLSREESVVLVLDVTEVVYDGTEHTPSASDMYYNEKLLVPSADYDLTYKNNINAGVATATVTFKGNYSGNRITNFTIIPVYKEIDGIDYEQGTENVGVFRVNISEKIEIPEKVNIIGKFSSVTYILYHAFINHAEIKSIIIPNSVTSIENKAFENCLGLSSITIPSSVTSIGQDAFLGCYFERQGFVNNSSLDAEANNYWGATVVDSKENGCLIVDGVLTKYIGNENSVTIPNSVKSIGYAAFSGCSNLTSVTIPNSVTSIGDEAFRNCSGLTSVTIPNSVTSIGWGAFRNCSGLTSVTIPNSVTSIGDWEFYNCSGLTQVTLNSNDIVSKSYSSGSTLRSIFGSQVKEYVLGDNVTSIGSYAFYNCADLTNITIGCSVESIEDYAFASIPKLEKIYCYSSNVPTVTRTSFENSYLDYVTLYVPASSLDTYKSTAPWKNAARILPLEDIKEKCATPTINYENGNISFNCETEGVRYVYNFSTPSESDESGSNIGMPKKLQVSVYATKEGFENSDVATKEIDLGTSGIRGDVNEDGTVNGTDIQEVINIIVNAE